MARNAKLREKHKWAIEKKPKLNNARSLRGIYFIDPEDKEQECSQEIGNTSGSLYALQDKQEQSELGDWW